MDSVLLRLAYFLFGVLVTLSGSAALEKYRQKQQCELPEIEMEMQDGGARW